jgi:predicted Zn-dependent protease
MPIAYALIEKHVRAARYPQALKIIQTHIDRKTAEKLFVLTYNTAKINQILGNLKNTVFYLENLLKEEPFFPQAVYDLAFLYSKSFNRNGEAMGLLQRHLTGVLKDNSLIHSAFLALSCDSKSTTT